MEEIKNTEAVQSDESKIKKEGRASLVINIITGVVLVLALVFLIEALYANKTLHNNYFGYAIVSVETDSMNIGTDESIKAGDLIFVKILSKNKKDTLQKDDIVTFRYYLHEKDGEVLLTHRIIGTENGQYVTHGDANPDEAAIEHAKFSDVVGVYKGKINKLGKVGLFFQTKAGSFVMVVVPFLVLLLLSAVQFIRNLRVYNKEKITLVAESTRSTVLSEEKERMRLEILAELEKEKNALKDDKKGDSSNSDK